MCDRKMINFFCETNKYRFGLSESTKSLNKARDSVRSRIKTAGHNKKSIFLQKYKALRNKATCLIRKENIDFYNNRVSEALDPINPAQNTTLHHLLLPPDTQLHQTSPITLHQIQAMHNPASLSCISHYLNLPHRVTRKTLLYALR